MEKSTRLTLEQRADLVAYLDGELDEPGRKEIERVLAGSEVARHEVEMLQRTWDLLDELPRTTASAEFTRRTLDSLQAQPARHWLLRRAWFPAARRGAILAGWAAALAVAAVVGYLTTHRWVPTETDQLLANLPVIEHLELYRHVGEVEFAERLQKTGLFHSDIPLPLLAGGVTRDPAVHDSRRRRIEQISSDERETLQENFKTFQSLSAIERDSYRRLHSMLQRDAEQGGRLLNVLDAYRQWLDGLFTHERKMLKEETNPELRIELVRRINDQEQWSQPVRPEPPAGAIPGPLGPTDDFRPALSAADLDSLLRVIQGDLELSTSGGERLRSVPRAQRHLHVLVAALKQQQREHDRLRSQWPPAEMLNRLIGSIADDRLRTRLADIDNVQAQRNALSALIVKGVRDECWEELQRRASQFTGDLDAADKRKLRDLGDKQQRNRALLRMYFRAHPEEPFSRDLFELNRLLLRSRRFDPDDRDRRRGIMPGGPPERDRQRPGLRERGPRRVRPPIGSPQGQSH